MFLECVQHVDGLGVPVLDVVPPVLQAHEVRPFGAPSVLNLNDRGLAAAEVLVTNHAPCFFTGLFAGHFLLSSTIASAYLNASMGLLT